MSEQKECQGAGCPRRGTYEGAFTDKEVCITLQQLMADELAMDYVDCPFKPEYASAREFVVVALQSRITQQQPVQGFE